MGFPFGGWEIKGAERRMKIVMILCYFYFSSPMFDHAGGGG
jgi:hypothetical protein